MSVTRREVLLGAAAIAASPLAGLFRSRGLKLRIGATDWNLREECKIEAIALARKIGFDGVEVSLGVADPKLPLDDKALQQRYRAEARRNRIAIAGTCLNVLHRNYLKNDKLGQKWVADS